MLSFSYKTGRFGIVANESSIQENKKDGSKRLESTFGFQKREKKTYCIVGKKNVKQFIRVELSKIYDCQ